MTKSTKHKRSRKQDLNKIKLKLGKKLRKGQNETKTEFKARKIILKEQLSAKIPSSLITKKNLNVSELLSRLSHASVFVRQDGLNGLKEIVLRNTKHELGPYLSNLFKGLNPRILDTDHLIRTTAVHVIDALVMKIGTMVQPYFQLLASHLSCAMVHLNTGVQSDSLKLMDVLLSHATSLVAQNANTILKNFFMLISRKINSLSTNNVHTADALISNPSSSLATIKWRTKLLRSLSRYLEAILEECIKLESSVPVTPWRVIMIGSFPPLVKREGARAAIHGTKILTDEVETKTFVQRLVPLLFQTWAEVEHISQDEFAPGMPLNPVAIELLRYITEILVHLWKITELATHDTPGNCEWFMKILHKYLKSNILAGFPYTPLKTHEIEPSTKTKSKRNVDLECQSLNISLSSLAFLYSRENSQLKTDVAVYYINLLNTSNAAAPVQKLNTVASTVSILLDEESGISKTRCEKLLSAALLCYRNVSTRSRYHLLKLPLKASDYSCKRLWRSYILKEWITEVVKDAIANPKEKFIFELMLQFKLRNTPGFAEIISDSRQLLKQRIAEETANNNFSNMMIVM